MNKLSFIVVLFIVLALAAVTYHLSTNIEKTTGQADPRLRHDPDYFISDFVATVYDAKGKANYQIKASHMDHFPDDDTVLVTNLEIKYMVQDREVWIARSNEATGYENIDVLHLSGDVKVENMPADTNKKLILQTPKLRIDFDKNHASTSQQVKITGNKSTIDAIGMDVDLNNGILKLNSQARGVYVPD